MYPKSRKKLIKSLKKQIKRMEEGKEELIPMDVCMKQIKDKMERDKHFPYSIGRWFRIKKRRIADRWYWLKCYFFHPYNVVKAKTLPPTWVDADTRMLHICFEILRSVIEDERLFECVSFDESSEIEKMEKEDWGEDREKNRLETIGFLKKRQEQNIHDEKEIRYLYKWWKELRPARIIKEDESLPYSDSFEEGFKDKNYGIACEKHLELEEKGHQEDTDNLVRLMKIRRILWV